MNYTAEIIAVRTEILLGNISNTDAKDVSEALSELGINVYYHTVVGDNPERVRAAVDIAKERADIIITTGGLGPTYDDLTKQTLAAAFGKEMYFDEAQADKIKSYFASQPGRKMTPNNLQQAWFPIGCTVFENSCGTAPGCAFESNGRHVLMLPGPPRECRAMIKTGVMPYLTKLQEAEIHSHNIRVFGMGESTMEAKLHDMMTELTNPTLAPYAKEGEAMCRLTARAKSKEEAEKMMAPVLEKVREILGDVIYGVDVDSLEQAVFLALKEAGKTVAFAESCTGGLASKRLTDLPGASAVFPGGIVTYSNSAKAELLGIDPALIEEKGAVSAEVALEMARSVRNRLGSDIGIG
ncbi:MAG: competence/damage-inducible protein A, partial [Firmicutes bacterium]|nr:competence/damage-inducible protein A [Bacillota bacterium]